MAIVTRTAYQAWETGWATSDALWWIPYLYRPSVSPWFSTAEDAVTWAENMIQSALDYIAENPDPVVRPPRYQITSTTEIRDEGTPTALTDPT